MYKTQVESKIVELGRAYKNPLFFERVKPSLFSGDAGAFMFRLYYASYKDENDPQLAEELVDFITERLEKGFASHTFCNGISGFAWFLNHLNENSFVELDEDLFQDFDEVVIESVEADFKAKRHDYLHGGLGSVLYLIRRSEKSDACKAALVHVVSELRRVGEENENGVFWVESGEMLDEKSKDNRVINLHISHGQAGKIVVLSKIMNAGVKEAESLLRDAVRYLCSQKTKEDKQSVIPAVIVNDEMHEFVHLGWCRGNVSIAAALMFAAKTLKDEVLMDEAVQIGVHSLSLNTTELAKVFDVAFCHGTAGLSYMYLSLFQYSGDKRFQAASDHWMNETLLKGTYVDGVAGFKCRHGITKEWINDYSLLTGVAGTGLVMLAYLNSERNEWDELFLMG